MKIKTGRFSQEKNFLFGYQQFIYLWLITLCLIFLANSALTEEIEPKLPPLQTYSLPLSLQNWQDDSSDNYFSEIKPHQVGYLLWSHFPVKVYVESPPMELSESSYLRFKSWQQIAAKAIAIWHPYLPLTKVEEETEADILIYRRQPERKAKLNPETGLYDLPRATAATTTIKFYLTESQPQQLRHQMIIEVNPNQTQDYLLANITHELGHALGIWGHSPEKTDVMYYSHTREIPQITVRDINTLKLIYQQPTRLGGQLTRDD